MILFKDIHHRRCRVCIPSAGVHSARHFRDRPLTPAEATVELARDRGTGRDSEMRDAEISQMRPDSQRLIIFPSSSSGSSGDQSVGDPRRGELRGAAVQYAVQAL